ncbi:MAG: hypothetical protein JXK16_03515 [Thiotrichales bacterium]|nr:hypothetical protein [Thiotrichales bacterium]
MVKHLLIVLFVLTLTACASPYPMGMSEEQWQKLTPNERQSLLLKQQEYDEQQRLQRQQAQAKQRELELALQIQEEQRLAQLYANPIEGNVVMINLLSGEYRYKKRVFQIQPISILLARGETKEIRLALRDAKGKRSSERAFVKYNSEGTGLYLYLNTPSKYNDDYIAVLRDGRWNCGSNSQHQFAYNQNESLQNLQLFVKDKNAKCRPQYSAPQHGQPYPIGRPIPNRR